MSGTGKDKLNVNRVVLLVDGVIKADSVLASGFLSANQSVNVFWDYITPGNHTVTLEAYGTLHAFTGKLTVTLGKVGKVIVNGALPGIVIP